jgi:predicted transposase/invertase (TIGR01784 family)
MTYADALLYYIANGENIDDEEMAILIDKAPEIKAINEILDKMSADPETARLIEEKHKYEMDYHSEMALIYEKGKSKGEFEKAVKVAQAMLAKGLVSDFIFKITGLPVSEIKRIAGDRYN